MNAAGKQGSQSGLPLSLQIVSRQQIERLLTRSHADEHPLRSLGIQVADRLPVLVEPNRYSAEYLDVKRRRMQHELPSSVGHARPEAEESAPIPTIEARKVSGD